MTSPKHGFEAPDKKRAANIAFALLAISMLMLVVIGCARFTTSRSNNNASSNDAQKKLDDERRAKEAKEESERRAFSDYASQLASDPKYKGTKRGNGYVKGKILVIDRTVKKIDPIQSQLPEDLRATRSDEVGTVVMLDWNSVLVGHYDYGGEGRAYTCNASVVDKSIPAPVGSKNFRGSDPPSSVRYTKGSPPSGPQYGDKPTEEIVNYLKSLPRK